MNPESSYLSFLPRCRFFLICLFALAMTSVSEASSSGEVLYVQHCARCHGEKGEGTSEAPASLTGDRSLRELIELIDQTMPEDDPSHCVGEEAEIVAKYIYDEFYSILAQERNRPARIEFARLTVRQYEHAVADLIGSFRPQPQVGNVQGLKGAYFKQRWRNQNNLLFERVDPQIGFEFGEGLPLNEASPAEENLSDDDPGQQTGSTHQSEPTEPLKPEDLEYSIRWSGAFFAPQTGEYELIVESENGFSLWVNDPKTSVIDAVVKSSNQEDERVRMRLLGGRWYSIRLELDRYRESKGSMRLMWKPPHQAAELIPSRYLRPDWVPQLFVLKTPFPPDDRSIGYERGNSVSKEWHEAAVRAGFEVADDVVLHLDELSKTSASDAANLPQIQEWIYTFIERAQRRVLSEDEKQILTGRHFDEAESPQQAVRTIVLQTLLSPRFLYREPGPMDSHSTASWLAMALWDSIPDAALIEAAKTNQLETRDQLEAQIQRMLKDPRSQAKLKTFFYQWLKLDHAEEIAPSSSLFPEFDEQILSDLRVSMELMLDEIVSSPEADFRRVLTTDEIYLNQRLAALYGKEVSHPDLFEKVSFAEEGRAGVLTHPLIMTAFSYPETTSPIHRGVFLSRSVLGRRLKPPPEAFAPLAPDLHPSLTTRERTHLQTSPAACQSCHTMINPLGFSLEHFDAIGRYRESEKERPIDASGVYVDRSGDSYQFSGSRGLSEFLVNHHETHLAFVEQLFQYVIKQPLRAFGETQLEDLTDTFRQQEFQIHQLFGEIVLASTMKARELKSVTQQNQKTESTSQTATVR